MNIAILGSGAYGLALAIAFQKNKNNISVWSKFPEEVTELKSKHSSSKLPDVKIPKTIFFSNDMKTCLEKANIIVIAVPIIAIRATLLELKKYLKSSQHICIASKGIEQETNLFVTDIIKDCIKSKNIAIISGPSFAIDVAKGNPIGLAIAGTNKRTVQLIKNALASDSLKLRTSKDMLGLEICSSIKNVIAIASGMIAGLGLPESTQAFLITESIHDIKYLIFKLGGKKKTILTFAGVGDLFLTCTSEKSRNFRLGKLFGEHKSKKEIEEFIKNNTIEGLYTLKSIQDLVNKKRIKLPIVDILNSIIYKNEDCNKLKEFLITKN